MVCGTGVKEPALYRGCVAQGGGVAQGLLHRVRLEIFLKFYSCYAVHFASIYMKEKSFKW